MASVDVAQMVKSLKPALASMEGLAYGTAKQVFDKRKRDFLDKDFAADPVVKELGGPAPETNPTSFLPNGYGNLFALLGFNKGTDLIGPVREKLDKETSLEHKPGLVEQGGRSLFFRFNIKTPDEKSIEKSAPHPPEWDSRPWTRILEDGVPGFAWFVFTLKGFRGDANSRSTTGLERMNRKIPLGGTVPRIPFLKNLLSRMALKLGGNQ